jgi:hypothetical protein
VAVEADFLVVNYPKIPSQLQSCSSRVVLLYFLLTQVVIQSESHQLQLQNPYCCISLWACPKCWAKKIEQTQIFFGFFAFFCHF